MARFSRAARAGDAIRGRCDMHIHHHGHHCWHRLSGTCNGSCNVYIEGKPAQKVGDSVIFNSCQHGGGGTIDEGSHSVYINQKPAARIKDAGNCGRCGQDFYIIEGAATVFFGD